MSRLPSTISGFTVLPVIYPSSATHILYARPHSGSKGASPKRFPENRTLFLSNVPPDATERELILFFQYAGTVEKVVFEQYVSESQDDIEDQDDSDNEGEKMQEDEPDDREPARREGSRKRKKKGAKEDGPPKVIPLPIIPLRTLRRSGGTAHLIFLDSSSVGRALASPKPRPWQRSEEPSGLAHYEVLYKALRPPLDAIRKHVDSYMAAFEYERAQLKQESKYRKGEAIVDEDGFTLVTRGGAYGKTLGGGVAVATKKFQETGETNSTSKRKKKNPKEKESFYAFQKAEKQRQGRC
jgi:ribosomal RNA-processing protein 7